MRICGSLSLYRRTNIREKVVPVPHLVPQLAFFVNTLLTVEGYFKPEEWADKEGVKHNRIMMVAVKFYPPVEKEETPEKPAKPAKKGKK